MVRYPLVLLNPTINTKFSCGKCEKLMVVQQLVPGTKTGSFTLMALVYVIGDIDVCQGCLKDIANLRETICKIAKKGGRLAPFQESLWPTPTKCTETQHSPTMRYSQEVPNELPLWTQDCFAHLGDMRRDMYHVSCDVGTSAAILGAKGEEVKDEILSQLAKLQAEANVCVTGSALAWDLLCRVASSQVREKTTAIRASVAFPYFAMPLKEWYGRKRARGHGDIPLSTGGTGSFSG